MTPAPGVHYNIILLGESNVGKTTILSRFMEEKFVPVQTTVVPASVYFKDVVLDPTSQRCVTPGPTFTVQLQLWDTAGQERFDCLTRLHYQASDGDNFT